MLHSGICTELPVGIRQKTETQRLKKKKKKKRHHPQERNRNIKTRETVSKVEEPSLQTPIPPGNSHSLRKSLMSAAPGLSDQHQVFPLQYPEAL